MSARSRRLATLPPIPECAQPELVIEQVRPHLEDLDTQSFSSLAQQLMQLCDTLQNSSSTTPSRATGAASRRASAPADLPTGAAPSAPPLRAWGDPATNHHCNQLAGAADSGAAPPLASAKATSYESPGAFSSIIGSIRAYGTWLS